MLSDLNIKIRAFLFDKLESCELESATSHEELKMVLKSFKSPIYSKFLGIIDMNSYCNAKKCIPIETRLLEA